MPKIVDSQLARNEIIEKSFTLFMKSGYQTVSMRNIAQNCGVTTGVLYHYFKNKNELVEAILIRQLAQEKNTATKDHAHLLSEVFENEDVSRTIVLMLVDLCRSQDGKLMKKGQELGSAFLGPKSTTKKLSSNQKIKRFYLTYAVGILITRLWSDSHTEVQDYMDSLKEFKIK